MCVQKPRLLTRWIRRDEQNKIKNNKHKVKNKQGLYTVVVICNKVII